MTYSLRKYTLFRLLNLMRSQCILQEQRKFCINQGCRTQKFTLALLPEIEKKLDSGEMKHRKHPGLKTKVPDPMPEVLKNVAYNILSEEMETVLREDAEELCKRLFQRRLPMEKHEIDQKILEKAPGYSGYYDELPDVLTKKEMTQLRKSINLEAGRWKPIEYDRHTSLAYLIGRLSPNYASTRFVFEELKKRVPDFTPKTYFDFGSGLGSAIWAANSVWPDSIQEYFCVDTSSDMNDLSQSILTDSNTKESFYKPVYYRQFLPASETVKYDLVVSAFSLQELESVVERLKVIDTLWRKTKDYLVIIELGTVAGFSCVLDARDYILKIENDDSPEFASYTSGAHVISPCPHDFPCPKFMEKKNSTCGFTIPYHPLYPRNQDKMILNDWISYTVIKKGPRSQADDISQLFPRVVKPVLRKSKHAYCHLCCSDGQLKTIIVTRNRHGRNVYRCVKACEPGDVLPAVVMPVLEDENDIPPEK